jgi:hypothetical protein
MARVLLYCSLLFLQFCAVFGSETDAASRKSKRGHIVVKSSGNASASYELGTSSPRVKAPFKPSKDHEDEHGIFPKANGLKEAIELRDIEAIKKFVAVNPRGSLSVFKASPTLCPWYHLACTKDASITRELLDMEEYREDMVILERCILSAIMCEFNEFVGYLATQLLTIHGLEPITNALETALEVKNIEAFGTIISLDEFDSTLFPLNPFMLQAINNDNQLVVRVILVSGKCQINEPLDKDLNTALHLAPSKAMASLLLQNGASKAVRNSQGQTPAERALSLENLPVYFVLADLIDRVLQMKTQFSYPPFTLELDDIDRSNPDIFEVCADLLLLSSTWVYDHAECFVAFRSERATDTGGPFNNWMGLMLSRLSKATRSIPSLDTEIEYGQIRESNALFVALPDLPLDVFVPNDAFISSSRRHSIEMLYKFAGILVAKALKQGIPLHMRFPPSVYKRLLGQKTLSFADLKDDDPVAYKGIKDLELLKESIGNLELNFLSKPGKAVTTENFDLYVEDFWNFRLNGYGKKANLDAFISGFHCVFPPKDMMLSSFLSWNELQEVMYGNVSDLKTADFKDNCVISGLSNEDFLSWFWEIVEGYSNDERLELFSFITGLPFVPYGGLQTLIPVITIHFDSYKSLLTSSTCTNDLFIPRNVHSKEELEEKLKQVLDNKLSWDFEEALDEGTMPSLGFGFDRNTNRLLGISYLQEQRKQKNDN